MTASSNQKKKLLSKDIPVIVLAFVLAFLFPQPVSPENFSQHISGIAIGFGIAWLMKFYMDWKKLNSSNNKGESDEA